MSVNNYRKERERMQFGDSLQAFLDAMEWYWKNGYTTIRADRNRQTWQVEGERNRRNG